MGPNAKHDHEGETKCRERAEKERDAKSVKTGKDHQKKRRQSGCSQDGTRGSPVSSLTDRQASNSDHHHSASVFPFRSAVHLNALPSLLLPFRCRTARFHDVSPLCVPLPIPIMLPSHSESFASREWRAGKKEKNKKAGASQLPSNTCPTTSLLFSSPRKT